MPPLRAPAHFRHTRWRPLYIKLGCLRMCPELLVPVFSVIAMFAAFSVFSVFSVFCAACALMSALALYHLRCSYKLPLCCASVWRVVAMWVAMVYDVWAAACLFLYAMDVPVGVVRHGDSLRPAGGTVLWQSGVGVYGMMLYVLMPCVLVDRRWARYHGSCLSHVGRRFSDVVRA